MLLLIIDGCPNIISVCTSEYLWPETDIGTIYVLDPCIQRRCGGQYSTGGVWEPVILTCPTDYVSCAVNELESLLAEALNNTEVCVRYLKLHSNFI